MVATIVKAILAALTGFSKCNLAFIQITISFPRKDHPACGWSFLMPENRNQFVT